jgi:hypothetical protein
LSCLSFNIKRKTEEGHWRNPGHNLTDGRPYCSIGKAFLEVLPWLLPFRFAISMMKVRNNFPISTVILKSSCNHAFIGQKERRFIKDLADKNEQKLNQKYTPNYKRVLKYRILQKRKTLTEDLLLINSVLDRLQ